MRAPTNPVKRRIGPSHYYVNGIEARRLQSGRWLVVWEPGVRSNTYPTFRRCMEAIADATKCMTIVDYGSKA